jgi:hypothetical protein
MKLRKVLLIVAGILLTAGLIIGRTSIGNLMKGNVHFPEEYVGKVLTMEDGQKFTVFRTLKVDGSGDNPDNLAVFKVRFKFKNLSSGANKRLSIIPAPFLMGTEGFREKDWTINESTNEFQGIYQWSSREAAEQYPDTFIFKLMTKRAAPGTVSYEILPNTEITEYLKILRDLKI